MVVNSQQAKPVAEVKAPPKPAVSNDAKKELQKIKSRFGQLETKLVELNKTKTELETALSDPDIYGDKNKFLQAEANYNKAAKELSDANKEYEEVFEKMMELEG